jgi:hypothetical protein
MTETPTPIKLEYMEVMHGSELIALKTERENTEYTNGLPNNGRMDPN